MTWRGQTKKGESDPWIGEEKKRRGGRYKPPVFTIIFPFAPVEGAEPKRRGKRKGKKKRPASIGEGGGEKKGGGEEEE